MMRNRAESDCKMNMKRNRDDCEGTMLLLLLSFVFLVLLASMCIILMLL